MDVEDIIKIILGLVFFLGPTLGRFLRGLARRGQKQPQPAPQESYEEYDRYEQDEPESDYEYDSEAYSDQYADPYAEPVEVGPEASRDPRAEARERIRTQLGDVFRSLGLDVAFEQPERPEPPPLAQPELIEADLEQDQTPEAYENLLRLQKLEREMEARRQATLARADGLRVGRHLNAESARSLAVIRDALVLDALLHRPKFGEPPLRRGPR